MHVSNNFLTFPLFSFPLSPSQMVIQDLGDEVIVAWDHWQNESKKTDRYFRDELRFWQPQ
ncbi:ATPase involved in DNA repair (plasmid) [Nostoc flagelliforme CCNUN1]|uniref:ATPase involved in DNA repair n=1 Tax=Nostoc flagelliforme CCNUN1 TaxID=2038116 RepID=A0A2K8T9C9_9NOSO|nr:hypothetical protein [Nostoc flagelliforme]AUB44298.1 hypothetical protein COO91_10521 [Nostoc flagelliforme CCNUN1]AUB44484.1 ATPase involved in DNA repair [Nostoc flagelliforme CCNUN1]